MLVKDYMTRHPIMIPPTMPAADAQKVMVENKLRHLPVVGDGKRPLGLMTRERLRIPPADLGSLNMWEITRYLSELKVKDVMVTQQDLLTIRPDATVEEAAQTMAEHRYGCLPVVEDNVVVGIITETDLLVKLADLLGGYISGVRVTVRLPGKIGGYAKIISTISGHGWGTYATGSVPAPKREGYWDIVLKVRDVGKEELLAVLEELEDCEIIDVRET
ncbi:MAG: CBS domain-containing protein [Anaerolineae bacterium]|jgi:acetoin utilization protein AcuB